MRIYSMEYPYDDNCDIPRPMAEVSITPSFPSDLPLPLEKMPVKSIPALLDTGSDICVVPKDILEQMEEEWGNKLFYDFSEVISVNGKEYKKSCDLGVLTEKHMCFKDEPRVKFVIGDIEHAILGRNFLNNYSVVFDGPNSKWSSKSKSSN